MHRGQVTGGGGREASLHHVHTQAGELAGDLQLFLLVQRRARGLFTVAQGGVEDNDLVALGNLPRPGGDVGDGKTGYVDVNCALDDDFLTFICLAHYTSPGIGNDPTARLAPVE